MGRTKLEIDISVLGRRSRSMHIIVGPTTTCTEVVRKVLQKCRVSDPVPKYQLSVTAKGEDKEQLLRDDDKPSIVHSSWQGSPTFHLRFRTSGLVRVYYSSVAGQGHQTFQSLIITPSMTSRDVIQLAVARLSPGEKCVDFDLVVKNRGVGERVLGEDECPLYLQQQNIQLELQRKRKMEKDIPPSPARTNGPLPHPPPSLSAIATANSDRLTPVDLYRGNLQLHSELIAALQHFSASSQATGGATPHSREGVLEQAVVEQNQILDIMQELVTSLEAENQFSRRKIQSQAHALQELSAWEARANQAERQLRDVQGRAGVVGAASTGRIPFAAMTGSEKAHAQKDKLIASLQSQLESLPPAMRQRVSSEGQERLPSAAILASTRAKLESERVRVIELEEELSARREDLNHKKGELSEKRTVLISKESEVLHLRHEMDSLKKFHSQQQDVMMSLRTALMDKDVQLTSLTRALSKEKNTSDALRNKQPSPKTAFPKGRIRPPHLFEQVSGRDILAVELTRQSSGVELGFSFGKVELPVSSRLPCVVVKAVREGSIAHGVLQPGDELLEANGYSFRSLDQDKAIESLETLVGLLRLVVARDSELDLFHSTPVKPQRPSQMSSGRSSLWVTALQDADTSFTSNSTLPDSGSGEFASVFSSPSSLVKRFQLPLTSIEGSATPNGESLEVTFTQQLDARPHPSYRQLQSEIANLRDELNESEAAKIELENELDETSNAMEDLKMEYDLTKGENYELQQQLDTSDTEMATIQHQVTELQDMLTQLQQQVAGEQARTAKVELVNHSLLEQLEGAQKDYKSAKKEFSEAQKKLHQLTAETEEQMREMKEEAGMLRSRNEQLRSDVAHRQSDLEEVSRQLESRKAECEQTKASLDGENRRLKAELQSLQESLVKTSTSSREEIEQLCTQVQSARGLLMQAEMKESSTTIELRHLKQAADMANEQLERMEEESRTRRDELGKYRQLAETKTLEMETLTLGLKAAQNKLQANKNLVSRLQGEVDNLRRSSAWLQTESGKEGAARTKMERKVSAVESENSLLEEKLHDSTEEKDVLFQQLEDAIDENTALQQQLDGQQSKVVELQGDAQMARQQGEQLGKALKELSAAKRDLEEESVKRIELLKAEKAVLEQEVINTRSDAALVMENTHSSSSEAKREVVRLQSEVDRQREALVKCEGRRVEVERDCEAMRRSEARSLQEVESLKSENEGLSQTVAILRKVQDEKDRELDSQQKKLAGLGKQCSSLQEKVRSLEEGKESQRRELGETKEEIQRLSDSRQDHEQQIVEGQLQLGQVSRELEVKTEELVEVHTSCEQLREELELERGRNQQIHSNVQQLQSQVEGLQASKRQGEEMLSSMEFVHQQDQSKLEQVVESLKSREEEIAGTREELSSLQQSSRAELLQLKSENAGLSESTAALMQQLRENEEKREEEVLCLREKLRALEQELGTAKDELQGQRSANSINQATTSQLQASLKHAVEERYTTQVRLDELTRAAQVLQGELSHTKEHASQLQSEKTHAESTNVSLSMESVTTKQQLRQARNDLDDLRAKLQAMEMNLDVANRSLGESEDDRNTSVEKATHLELQLGEASGRVEKLETDAAKASLDLHAKDELLSQLRANLELRKGECQQLQQSLMSAQSTAILQERRVATLEGEKADLEGRLHQLRGYQEGLKDSLVAMEAKNAQEEQEHKRQASSCAEELEELRRREKGYIEKVEKLEMAYSETKSITEQLLAAQEALKGSLSTLGNEKEKEILKLSQQVTDLESSLVGAQKELAESRGRERELQSKAQKLEEEWRLTKEEREELRVQTDKLQAEVAIHQATEVRLNELHSKVSQLEGNLMDKTERLGQLTHAHHSTDAELRETRAESKGLLEKISQLASTKVSLAETTTEVDRLHGELANEMKAKQALASERDQLLSMLRRLEVEKHTAAVQQPSPKLSREASKEQVVAQLKDKEEEAFRLREYVGKLLTAVVEKAPFVLENMH